MFNVLLTTNFDDLVADALFLFTQTRPLVIPHETLAPYIRSTRTRPLIVKLPSDRRLSPYSTPADTATLAPAMSRKSEPSLSTAASSFWDMEETIGVS